MARSQDFLRAMHAYREATGKTEIEMRDVAAYAIQHLGWQLPKPISPEERLAKDFAKAAREEVRRDKETGRPYRANHAVTDRSKTGQQTTLWGDIDTAPRAFVHRSLQQRREQMVGDAVQLSFDLDHWNRVHVDEEPIEIEFDFAPDIEWRKAGPDDDEKQAS